MLKKVYGTGDGSTVVFFLNGFQHRTLSTDIVPSFLIGISDADSAFDMIYSSALVRPGQVSLSRGHPFMTSYTLRGEG